MERVFGRVGGNRTKHVKAIFLYSGCGLWISRGLSIGIRRKMETVRRGEGGKRGRGGECYAEKSSAGYTPR